MGPCKFAVIFPVKSHSQKLPHNISICTVELAVKLGLSILLYNQITESLKYTKK